MTGRAEGNLLIAHGGGPTAVINSSLYGVVRQARSSDAVGRILGARFGITGVLAERFVDLDAQPSEVIEGLKTTPGSALGSCRHKVTPEDCRRVVEVLKKHDVRWFLYNGGNDSMDTALRVHRLAVDQGHEVGVIGIPKTVDNDLPVTDRCPGYGSAARYMAQTVRDLGVDVRSLPIPVTIVEAMGRNTGWIAAAAALARTGPDSAPQLIYLPERPFETDRFLADVEAVVGRLGWAVVVVAEGIRRADGGPVHMTGDESQKDAFGHALPGDVSHRLAALVAAKLKIRCRSEKPGICGRCSIMLQSPVDRDDAEQAGRAAVDAALEGHSGRMVTLLPRSDAQEPVRTGLAPLDEVANLEKPLPQEYIDPSGTDVTAGFVQYVRPLIGPPLLDYIRLD